MNRSAAVVETRAAAHRMIRECCVWRFAPCRAPFPVDRLQTQIRPTCTSPILFLLALILSVVGANAQPANAPDPLVTLMRSQPPIITTAPTQVTAVFDPPVVRVGEEATYRVTMDALLVSIEWPEKFPVTNGLHLRRNAQGQTLVTRRGPATVERV